MLITVLTKGLLNTPYINMMVQIPSVKNMLCLLTHCSCESRIMLFTKQHLWPIEKTILHSIESRPAFTDNPLTRIWFLARTKSPSFSNSRIKKLRPWFAKFKAFQGSFGNPESLQENIRKWQNILYSQIQPAIFTSSLLITNPQNLLRSVLPPLHPTNGFPDCQINVKKKCESTRTSRTRRAPLVIS